MMTPVGRLIVLRGTPRAGLVGALAWLTVPALLGPVLGPPLGGYITTYWDWRWIFWINIPIAVLGVIPAGRYIPDLREPEPRRFDAHGFLPLLLQIGFGLTPFQSGMLTFASGIGALAMKFAAQPLLRRFGFRRVLMLNAVVSAVFILAPASFSPTTPWPWLLLVLFIGGLSRSLQFTSVNAIAYAEVASERLSSVTSFSAVLQQLSGSIGITMAAMTLEATGWPRGGSATDLANFPVVFSLIAGLSLASALLFARLPPQAGAVLLRQQGH